MARMRTIKPEFFTSEQIVDCSVSARLLFIGLWCFCDDGGVHPASERRLKMEVFPADNVDVAPLIKELIGKRLVVEYEADGQRYWQVTGWKHQKIDRPTYRWPPFNPDEHQPLGGKDSSNARRTIVGHSTTERSVAERSVAEGSVAEAAAASPEPMSWQELGRAVCHAAGIDEARIAVDFSEAIGWTTAGFKPEVVLAAVRAVAARPGYKPPRSLRYFTQAIREAHEPPKPGRKAPVAAPARDLTDEEKRKSDEWWLMVARLQAKGLTYGARFREIPKHIQERLEAELRSASA